MVKEIVKTFFIKKRKARSVFFYGQSYYHFYYLAKALRKRSWDAITVNFEDPKGVNAKFYHGQDINLYRPNCRRMHTKVERFIKMANKRFNLMHFAGDSYLCFHPGNWELSDPPEIVDWRSSGKKIAYTVSGCNSATLQSSVVKWSSFDGANVACNRCIWQLHPDVCNDHKSVVWGKKLEKHCDIIFAETLPALDYIASHQNVIRDPLTMCLDPDLWSDKLRIPKKWKIKRESKELLVYHAVGNYESRSQQGRNIKGTPAIAAAVDRLKEEGMKVRLIFVTNIPNKQVRYLQAQADVIIDQLNYGRYGANAREGMMLGKPVICYINKHEIKKSDELPCLEEVPLVSATEETVYEKLKELLLDKSLREAISKASRDYAIKWHSADACAARYEKVYDELFA